MAAAVLLMALLIPLAFAGGDDDGDDGADAAAEDLPEETDTGAGLPDPAPRRIDDPEEGADDDADDPLADDMDDLPYGGAPDSFADPEPPQPVPAPVGDQVIDSYRSGGAAGNYNIDIAFSGSWTAEAQRSVIETAEYLSQVVLQDVRDVSGPNGADDLRIEARMVDIDGRGGVLGRGGATVLRSESLLPVRGYIEFDAADARAYLDNGEWPAVVMHEMLHTLGVGTVWQMQGQTTGSVGGGDLRFTGENALQVYTSDFADQAARDPGAARGVPLETGGGSGTAGSHWSEAAFGREVMTGWNEPGTYLSDLTIAALEDLGYDTFWDDVTDGTDRTAPRPANPLPQGRGVA